MIRLGSNSETRAEILRVNSIKFIQSSSHFDEESLESSNPKSFVYEATLGKLNSCIDQYGLDIPILVADTVVTANGKLLRKAYSREEAKATLLQQSGNRTSILTAMIYKSRDFEFIDISSTDYIFKEFDLVELERFLDSEEWKGKAGACMVEGFCKKYILSVDGYESTAMGLQVERLLPWL